MVTTVVLVLAALCVGAAIGRWLVMARAAGLLARERAEMAQDVEYWQAAAERANSEAARIAREAKSFAAGCKQGREDVISIMPLLVAANERPERLPHAVGERSDRL